MKNTLFAAVVRDDKEWTYEVYLVNNMGNSITFSGETGMYQEDLISNVGKVERQTIQPFGYVSLEKGNRNALDFTIWYRLFIYPETFRFVVNKGEEIELPILNQSGQLIELQKEDIMRKDSEWSIMDDDEPRRVIAFSPIASVQNGKVVAPDKTVPYASITLQYKQNKIEGFVTNRMDFAHLWAAFKERGVYDNEEVIVFWTVKNYKYKFLKFLSALLPKMWVMICPKDAFELMIDKDYKPELSGEARAKATLPIIDWKPEVMS